MKSTTFAVLSLFASAAIAQPHGHQRIHKKRDVAWVTQWESVTETVDVTETIWVSSGFVPPTTASEAPAKITSSTSASSSSATEAQAQFYQGGESSSSSSSVYVAPTPATTSIYEAPTPSSTYVAPTSSSSAAPYVAPVETPSTLSPVYVPTTTSTPVYVAPTTSTSVYVAPTTSATAVAKAASSDSSSSSGGASSGCTAGTPCDGDITYYEAGLGACGWTNDGSTENIVALPYELMGTQSNGNPYCGQMITIKCTTTGKTTTAKVADKCMGCEGKSIDLSNAAFLDLTELAVGRTTAEWWFN